jgi:hypothetical protein
MSTNKLDNYMGFSIEMKGPIGQDKELVNPTYNLEILN